MEKDDRKWEIIESEYLIRRPWLTARRDRVKLPTGVEIPEYYILEYPDWVNVIAITKEGKFVLVRQYRHGIKETRYEICAGFVKPEKEPFAFCPTRNCTKKIGYGNGNWTKLMTIFSKCQHHDKYHSLLSGYGGRTNLYPAFGRN